MNQKKELTLSKYSAIRYLPKTVIVIPNMETLNGSFPK